MVVVLGIVGLSALLIPGEQPDQFGFAKALFLGFGLLGIFVALGRLSKVMERQAEALESSQRSLASQNGQIQQAVGANAERLEQQGQILEPRGHAMEEMMTMHSERLEQQNQILDAQSRSMQQNMSLHAERLEQQNLILDARNTEVQKTMAVHAQRLDEQHRFLDTQSSELQRMMSVQQQAIDSQREALNRFAKAQDETAETRLLGSLVELTEQATGRGLNYPPPFVSHLESLSYKLALKTGLAHAYEERWKMQTELAYRNGNSLEIYEELKALEPTLTPREWRTVCRSALMALESEAPEDCNEAGSEYVARTIELVKAEAQEVESWSTGKP